MPKGILDFELTTLAIDKFIKHQESIAELWKNINETAFDVEMFYANFAKILLDKYQEDGNAIRLLTDILDMKEFYRDLVMEFLINEGLGYEIMDLGLEW